ncbi:hypothetical protein PMAYCL1PPCAC_14580 [Pristionchus mayeri]|uniref:Uncharacterized protein n=1 Tax=Pristionchus mayeri TaxID=1317129 RepID=A0AAN4ZVI7_9BILA|nr:hypothetical protein PMAYCL1PPCAC_14580 [Pristionchus mayeri]
MSSSSGDDDDETREPVDSEGSDIIRRLVEEQLGQLLAFPAGTDDEEDEDEEEWEQLNESAWQQFLPADDDEEDEVSVDSSQDVDEEQLSESVGELPPDVTGESQNISEDELSEGERVLREAEDQWRAVSASTSLLGACTICLNDDVVEPAMQEVQDARRLLHVRFSLGSRGRRASVSSMSGELAGEPETGTHSATTVLRIR